MLVVLNFIYCWNSLGKRWAENVIGELATEVFYQLNLGRRGANKSESIHFSLDDFGTGFSSLTYLQRLLVDLLKIDLTFFKDMLEKPDDRAIVRGIIGLATAFNRQAIVEGVETTAHGTQLLEMGFELAQGYGTARPMPAAEIPRWIVQWKPDLAWSK